MVSQNENLTGLYSWPLSFFSLRWLYVFLNLLRISAFISSPILSFLACSCCLFPLCNIILRFDLISNHFSSPLLSSPPGGISSSLYPSGKFPGLCPVPCSCSPFSLPGILTPSSPLRQPFFFPLFAISLHSKK